MIISNCLPHHGFGTAEGHCTVERRAAGAAAGGNCERKVCVVLNETAPMVAAVEEKVKAEAE